METEPKTICGGCLCGAVRYEGIGELYNVTHCHCEDCRKSAGAPFVTWASFQPSNFKFTKGKPLEIAWAGRVRSLAIGAQSIGALALGALAIGAFAVGVVAVGRLVIGRAKIRRLEIGDLVVNRLRVTDSLEIPRD